MQSFQTQSPWGESFGHFVFIKFFLVLVHIVYRTYYPM